MLLLGVLIGEGHFGGDGKQPHVVLRLHVRHEQLFRWIGQRWPQHRLYGPYHHGGRHYYQMMWRGTGLREELLPLLDSLPWETIDTHSFARYTAMKVRYGLAIEPLPAEGPLLGDAIASGETLRGESGLLDDEDA